MNTANTSDVLVITASNGENLKLAQRFVETAEVLGQSADLLDLTTIDLPLFTPRAQTQGTPQAIAPLETQLMAFTRWVICAPEYNGSIPPCLTNAIAWLSVQGMTSGLSSTAGPSQSPPSQVEVVWNSCCLYASSSPI